MHSYLEACPSSPLMLNYILDSIHSIAFYRMFQSKYRRILNQHYPAYIFVQKMLSVAYSKSTSEFTLFDVYQPFKFSLAGDRTEN